MISILLLIVFILVSIYILKVFIKAQYEYEELLEEKSKLLDTEYKKLRSQIFSRYIVKAVLAMLIFVLIFAITGIVIPFLNIK